MTKAAAAQARGAKAGPTTQELKERFKRLDLNRDGKLDFNELSSLLRRGRGNLQEYEIKALYDKVDKNSDGKVDFGEFVDYIMPGGEKPVDLLSQSMPNLQQSREGSKNSAAVGPASKLHHAPSGPGPGDYDLDRAVLSESCHRRGPTATIGHGPGHGLKGQYSTPGPGAYEKADAAKDSLAASSRGFNATIGSAPGHCIPRLGEDASPGPAYYSVPKPAKQGFTPTFGRAMTPQKEKRLRHTTPGPLDYSSTSSFMSVRNRRIPAATMGTGPRHTLETRTTASPGPGAYNARPIERHVKGGGYFGTGHKFGFNGQASSDDDQLRRSKDLFRASDKNLDGKLDFEEVQSLLLEGNPEMKTYQIKLLFDHVDKNSDGVVGLDEFIEFISDSGGNPFLSSMRRTLKKIMETNTPGPLDYTWEPQRSTLGGTMGRAPGH